MLVTFALCRVWTGAGGEFPFVNGQIQPVDDVRPSDLMNVYGAIYVLCNEVAGEAFPGNEDNAKEHADTLFEYLCARSSIQTVGGLNCYFMEGARNGVLLFKDGKILHNGEKETDVTAEWKEAMVYAMVHCGNARLFKTFIPTILIT